MKHKSSHHANVLMNGHNPEHSHHENKSHRGTSNVHHHMKDDHHSSHHGSSAKPCDILMRQHHYSGGITNVPPRYSHGGTAHRKRRYAEGGHVDPEVQNIPQMHPNNAYFHNAMPMQRRVVGAVAPGMSPSPMPGTMRTRGAAMYAEGGHVDHESKGGRTHHRRSRHAEGGEPMDKLQSRLNEIKEYYPNKYKKGGHCYAEGGEAKEYGEKPLTGQLRKGGRANHRHHHFEGEAVEGAPVADNSVRQEQKRGGRSKRQHHYWGQSFIGRLPLIGGLANSIANTAGTLDPHKYGGAEYVAKSKGQKAADIFSTIGNLGANVALSRKSKGGGVHHKHRHHHAAGGAGKVRKGMMTESGRMIHHDD